MKTCGQCKFMEHHPKFPNIGACTAPVSEAWKSYSGGETHVDDDQAEDCALFTAVDPTPIVSPS